MKALFPLGSLLAALASVAAAAQTASQSPVPIPGQTIDLPTSKQLIGPIPGNPQRINSLPMSMAVSPDGRYVVTVNAGYGTYLSHYDQSLTVMDTKTGKLEDFPDQRTDPKIKQTLFSGLAFSLDGAHLYATMGSLSKPTGDGHETLGNGFLVYTFRAGKIAPERFIPLPLAALGPGHKTQTTPNPSSAVPFPAAIAVLGTPAHEKLLVADNLSDDVVLLDASTGAIEKRFDLSESATVPGTYPIALALTKDRQHAFVALWNASEIAELDLAKGTVQRKLALLKPSNPVAPGTHPCAFVLSPDGATLYVALANRDAVAAVNVGSGQFSVKGYFDTRLPGQSYFGAEPDALALNADASRLYVADSAINAVAVIDTTRLTPQTVKTGMAEPVGFVPTDWMPMSMAFLGSGGSGKLYVATAKGKGAGPNGGHVWDRETEGETKPSSYIATLLFGSLAVLDAGQVEKDLPHWTSVVLESNRLKAAEEKIAFAGGRPNPIKHVIYIIRENRTYDQLLGDLAQNGQPVANGDPKLTTYGQDITPNIHKLALQFGVLDNFYDSGEVSGDGHVWSTAAIGTDYLEKTWQQSYRNGQRSYDYEGVVADGLPLEQHIPDVNEPASGYLWGNLASHGKTYYHFAEYIASTFCDQVASNNPQQGPVLAGPGSESAACAGKGAIRPGAPLPAAWGGGVNKWPWPIPTIASNHATKPELVGHFAPESPDFNLDIPDQIRVQIFLRHLQGWLADKQAGKDTMPNFIMLRLPNDHTEGTRPGKPTPKSSVADNDLAVGRAVEAIANSPFWDDTAFFVLEDDAQAGADHVDAHRSLAVVVSKYAPHGPAGAPFIDSRFYSTVSVIRTMENLLALPPMNNNDAFSSLISTLFTGPGDQAPFKADYSNRDNGLIYTANAKNAVGAKASMKMDFTHADRAPTQKLNVILWKDAMGNAPVPAMLKAKGKKEARDDDD
jgi:DNA-binding beta-propeller fold protein YncE